MKKLVFLFAITCLSMNSNYAQFYERTGKNFGAYLALNPFTHVKNETTSEAFHTFSGSVGLVKMVHPGIYPSLGYTFGRQVFSLERMDSNFPVHAQHTLDASLLMDKRLAKLMNKRIKGVCHYLALGLIFAPEYHYMFGTADRPNYSSGEFAAQVGLSLYHHYSSANKKARGRTIQYDLFFRKGFTPIFTAATQGGYHDFYRQEVGLRIRFIKHQVYDFLK
jgi:hypothetical protein